MQPRPDASFPSHPSPGWNGPTVEHESKAHGAVGASLVLGVGGIAVGAVLVLVGSFLPWVSSGGVHRNSYSIAGVADRFDLFDNWLLTAALSGWPAVGPWCVVILCLLCLRLRRWAAALAITLGLVAGAITITVLAMLGDRAALGVALTATGPWVLLAGAAVLLIGGIALVMSNRR